MTSVPDIKSAYFNWLYDQVIVPESKYSYRFVCAHLHAAEFDDRVPNDDNRTAEGEELRDEFLSRRPVTVMEDYASIYEMGKASVLEVLIGLSRRAEFQTGMFSNYWIQVFLRNLGLDRFDDKFFRESQGPLIDKIIRKFNDRTYQPNGKGGIFPLKNPDTDQRKTELSYQMASYMRENKMY